MAREGGEARCPAHEVVEGAGFHVFGLWCACVPFLEMERAARAYVWLWVYLLYHGCVLCCVVLYCESESK
jgi:hypothetical protein